jgi:hypothetical protein
MRTNFRVLWQARWRHMKAAAARIGVRCFQNVGDGLDLTHPARGIRKPVRIIVSGGKTGDLFFLGAFFLCFVTFVDEASDCRAESNYSLTSIIYHFTYIPRTQTSAGAIQSGKNLAKQSASAKSMRSPSNSSLRGPQARGSLNSFSACFAAPEN